MTNGIVVRTSQTGIPVITTPTQPVSITVPRGNTGPKGPPGPPGQDAQWESMTQEEYDALADKDPQTLYVIVP